MLKPARIFFTAAAISAVSAVSAVSAFAGDGQKGDGQKIVVELFTSQGCSSCPPADAYLAELAKRDDVIALSFHVDYWNYNGWTDPFSMPEATARQRGYGRTMGKRYVYTPQIVVDGRAETVGSRRDNVTNLIRMAGAAPKVRIDVAHNKDGTADIRLPAAPSHQYGELWIGFYDNTRRTEVEAGENSGETITNTNIVRTFRRLGTWDGVAMKTRVDLKALGSQGRDGCVIVLQAPDSGPILGAAAFPLPRS